MDRPPMYDPADYEPLDTGITLTPGDTVRILRELNEMSQAQLAELSGIPQTTLSAIESGRTRLGAERSKKLAKVFKVHPAVSASTPLRPSFLLMMTRRPQAQRPEYNQA